MSDGYKQKRRHRREKMIAEVWYKDEKKHSFGGCISKDVSVNGVCIKIEEFVAVGTLLDLEFRLPLSKTPFYIKGKVMWINKLPLNEQWEVGLQIVTETDYARLVQQYISSMNPND